MKEQIKDLQTQLLVKETELERIEKTNTNKDVLTDANAKLQELKEKLVNTR